MDQLAYLTDRWNTLLPGAAALGVELLDRYQQASRRYHDTRHLFEVIGHLDELMSSAGVLPTTVTAWVTPSGRNSRSRISS